MVIKITLIIIIITLIIITRKIIIMIKKIIIFIMILYMIFFPQQTKKFNIKKKIYHKQL